MSMEQALVSRVRPHMSAAMVLSLMEPEMIKGCLPDIAPHPVALEPPYRQLTQNRDILENPPGAALTPERPVRADELLRLNLWLGPEQECDWSRSELFLKQLVSAGHRMAFEIAGNEERIALSFLCHETDAPVVHAAFEGEFPHCRLCAGQPSPLTGLPPQAWEGTVLREYYPPPPYSHLFTRPDELRTSPLETLLRAMAGISAPGIGVYQTVFMPVPANHDWHGNTQILLDLEYKLKLYEGTQPYLRAAQQSPSSDLRGMALDADNKAHDHKPLYAAIARVAVAGGSTPKAQSYLRALSTFINLFRHGGHPLNALSEEDFRRHLSPNEIRDMFLLGNSYRAGFLLNSLELTGFAHLPSYAGLFDRELPVDTLDGLSPPSKGLSSGTFIGSRGYAGVIVRVCIPPDVRGRHGHVIGIPGMGKSCLLEHMCLEDIAQGHGVAILDLHGDLAERVMALLPEECAGRVVYFDPGDPEWVPLWNPLTLRPGQEPSRVTDELVAALKTISDGWGDRLAHLLNMTIRGSLHVEDITVFDVSTLIKSNTKRNDKRREQIADAVENKTVREFWKHDMQGYTRSERSPATHKLSKLLGPDTVERILSQPESRINFREIMDEGRIFVANLSTIGPSVGETLGSFLLSFFYLAAISRSDILEKARRPFHIYADEAHRFVSGSVSNLIAETRKYRVSMTLAHQYLSQFRAEDFDSLGTAGSTIAFNVLPKDAERLAKALGNGVQASDLTTLGVGEAIARIGTEVVRIKTPPPREVGGASVRERAVAASRQRYCKHVRELSPNAGGVRAPTPAPFAGAGDFREEDFAYERLL